MRKSENSNGSAVRLSYVHRAGFAGRYSSGGLRVPALTAVILPFSSALLHASFRHAFMFSSGSGSVGSCQSPLTSPSVQQAAQVSGVVKEDFRIPVFSLLF